MPNRATRKGATAAQRASKAPALARASTPQVASPDPALPLDNPRHERFAIEYLTDFKAGPAYLRAYGGKPSSAHKAGPRLLTNVDVLARVGHLCREALGPNKLEGQKVVLAVARVAYQDIRRAFDKKGNLLPIQELPDEIAGAIAGIEIFEEYEGKGKDRVFVGYTKKIRMSDRIPACSLLGKHYKLFTERTVLETPEPLRVQSEPNPEQRAALAAVRKRLSSLESRVQK